MADDKKAAEAKEEKKAEEKSDVKVLKEQTTPLDEIIKLQEKP